MDWYEDDLPPKADWVCKCMVEKYYIIHDNQK